MNLLFLALKTLKWLLILAVLLTLTVTAYIHFHPTFGGKPDAASLAKIRASEHYNGTLFQNLEPTELISHDHYDHLDYRAIRELDEKVGHYYVPLGVKAHL